MNARWLIIAVFCGVLAVWVAAPFLMEFSAVDRCLDAGGSFDYSNQVCDYESNHQDIPYGGRHPYAPFSFSIAAATSVLAVIVSARSKSRNLR